MSVSSSQAGYNGFQRPVDTSSESLGLSFIVQQRLLQVQTLTLCKVISVTNDGGVAPVGFVDVQPLVNQVDGEGNATPHGIIKNLPYSRLQGGANAIIMDPQVGDIGQVGHCSRDISSVKVNKSQSNPGSWRTFDFADGVYMGGILNGTPTQYVQFNSSGITVTSPVAVNINAPNATLSGNGVFTVDYPSIVLNGQISGGAEGDHILTGSLATTGDQVAGSGSANISQLSHIHSESGGSGDGGPPVSGT